MTADEWVDANTGFCDIMRARITKAQCVANKKSRELCGGCKGLSMAVTGTCPGCGRENMSCNGPLDELKCGSCYKHHKSGGIGIPEWLQRDLDKPTELPVVKQLPKENNKHKKDRRCSCCGEIRKIYSYGQCAKCLYKQYGKAMKPPAEVIATSYILSPVGDCHVSAKSILNLIPAVEFPVRVLELPDSIWLALDERGVNNLMLVELIELFLSDQLVIRRAA